MNEIFLFFTLKQGLKLPGSAIFIRVILLARAQLHTVLKCKGAWKLHSCCRLGKGKCGASLAVQWLRIRLPKQATQIWSPVGADTTCHRATEPMCHNY